MFKIIAVWLLQFLLLGGIGLLAQRLVWRQLVFGLFAGVWFGWAVLIGLLQIWHLLAPINEICLTLVVVICGAGLPSLIQLLRLRVEDQRAQANLGRLVWVGILFATVVTLMAQRTALPDLGEGDTLLYHLNVVRWNNEHAVVPGLANLHVRFGVHSSFLLYASLLDIGWADQRSSWLVTGFPVFLLWAQWLWVIFFRRGVEFLPGRIFCTLTLPYAVRLIEIQEPSLYFDKPPLIALLALGLGLLESRLFRLRGGASGRTEGVWLVTMAALAFTFKQSGAFVLALTALGVTVAFWMADTAGPGRWRRVWGDVWRTAVWPSVLVVGYLATNVILSGWLLFPAPVLGLPVSWAFPTQDTLDYYRVVSDWAKIPGAEGLTKVSEGFWSWFPHWRRTFFRNGEHVVLLLALGATALACWAVSGRLRRVIWRPWAVFYFALFGLVNLSFWFYTAPDLRFGDGLFHLWFGLMGSACLTLMTPRPFQITVAALLAVFLLGQFKPDLLPRRRFHLTHVPRAKAEPIVEARFDDTPTIWVPAHPETSDLLGDSPLPSAPLLDPRLRMRRPDSLAHGFFMAD